MHRLIQLLISVSLLDSVLANPPPSPGSGRLVPRTWQGKQYACKCYFDDDCWPRALEWNALNRTVDGNLEVYIPPEAACHNVFDGLLGSVTTYDAAKCAAVTASYSSEQWT